MQYSILSPKGFVRVLTVAGFFLQIQSSNKTGFDSCLRIHRHVSLDSNNYNGSNANNQ